VSREVAANGGCDGYRAWQAHRDVGQRARRPKTQSRPVTVSPRRSRSGWRSGGHRRRLPTGATRVRRRSDDVGEPRDDLPVAVRSRRGELRRELHRCLRTGRAQCRPRSRLESRGNIPDMVFTLFVPVKIQRVSPCHAGHTGTTSGMPSAPTVAICAQLDSRVVSAFTSSSSTLPPIGRLRPRDALCRRMNQPNSLLRVRRGG